MKTNKLQSSKTGRSIVSVIIWGVIVASLLSLLLSGLVTYLILNGHLSGKVMRTAIHTIRMISVLIGGLVGGAIIRQKYLQQVALTTLGYILVMSSIGICVFDGSFKNLLSGFTSALIGGIAAFVILKRTKDRKQFVKNR